MLAFRSQIHAPPHNNNNKNNIILENLIHIFPRNGMVLFHPLCINAFQDICAVTFSSRVGVPFLLLANFMRAGSVRKILAVTCIIIFIKIEPRLLVDLSGENDS